ncbi:MAG TPA: acyl-CoA desaturase [Rhizomicrobium sp.]|nr:acyl-CoA desaturase [Rhizomicrobium sp.]
MNIPVRPCGPERIVFDAEGDFLRTVRARVHETLQGCAPRGNPRQLRKAAFITVWFLGSFALMLAVTPLWLELLLAASWGLAASAVGFNIFHDANHGAMLPGARANLMVAVAASTVLGASRYLWNFKHHVLHHRFTNIQGWDDDLETRGFLRLSPQQDWKPRYRGQHVFVFVLYAINAIEMVFVKDWVQFFTLRINPHQRIPAMTGAEKLEFVLSKLAYLAVFVAQPFLLLPPLHALLCLLAYQVTLGLSLAFVFSMAHQVEAVAFPAPQGAPPRLAGGWAAHQMQTTANFATGSRAWTWFSGGLNHQIEHHLFPAIGHSHYAAIGPVVRRTAAEFGLPYHQYATWGGAIVSHVRLLRRLAARPGPETP